MARMKLPTGKEMQDWNLIALRKLSGSKHISEIDATIRNMMLALGVSAEESDFIPRESDKRNLLQHRAEAARSGTSREFIQNPKWGYWSLTRKGRAYADELMLNGKKRQLAAIERKQRSQADRQTLKSLADQADVAVGKIRLLQKYPITVADLEAMLKSRLDAQYQEGEFNGGAETSEGGRVRVESTNGSGAGGSVYDQRMQVEEDAINHILSKEPDWHRTPQGNHGFDLFQTDGGRRNGKKTKWCEVKSSSGPFTTVSLTPREVKEAQQRGNDYWLYIVENAGSKNANIIRINNPAYRTDERFTFGQDWRNRADG